PAPGGQESRKARSRGAGGGPSLEIATSALRANVARLRSLLALGDLELDRLALVQGPVAGGLDGRVVHEHVRAAAIGLDESETLFSVEPLHGAGRHTTYSLRQNG